MIAPIAHLDPRRRDPATNDRIVSQWRDDERGVPRVKGLQRRHVEMVVMIVRQQYRIDLGQGPEFDAGRGHAAWTGKSDGACAVRPDRIGKDRSEEHTSELQSLMRTSYAVFCLTNKNKLQA